MIFYENDRLANPFDDEKLRYVIKDHRYVLERDIADFETGLVLSEIWQGEDNVLWYLDAISKVTYTYLTKFKDSKYYERMLYYLSHSQKARDMIFELMIDTIQYNHEDGGFLIAYQTGVNLHEMKDINIKLEMAISVIGKQVLHKYGIMQRLNNVNINEFEYFNTLEELLEDLFDKDLITEEEKDEIESLEEIVTNYQFRVFFNRGKYIYENLLTFKNALDTFGVVW